MHRLILLKFLKSLLPLILLILCYPQKVPFQSNGAGFNQNGRGRGGGRGGNMRGRGRGRGGRGGNGQASGTVRSTNVAGGNNNGPK